MPGSNEYSINPVLIARTGTGTGIGTGVTSSLVSKSVTTPTTDPTPDSTPAPTTDPYRENALQNSEHDNWRDAYAEYSGKKGSWRERRNFRRDWKDEANVRARVGEDTYDQLRAESEQKQFGTQGYNSGSTREKNRFNRRFNRKVRNGSLRPRVTNTPESTFTKSGTVLYPWLYDYRLPGSVWNTYNRTMNWLDQYQSNLTGVKEGVEEGVKEGDLVEKPTPVDYKAEGLKLLGKDYMTSDNLTKIQQFLVGKNYDLGTYGSGGKGVDGIYGQKTHEALSKYLNEVGNAEGWKNINDLFKPADPAGGGTPTGGANPAGAQIPAGGTPAGGGGANPPTALVTQTPSTDGATPTANTQNQFDFDNFVNEQNLSGDNIISKDGHRYVRFDPKGSRDFYVGDDGNIYTAGLFGRFTGTKLTRHKDGYAQFEGVGGKEIYSLGDKFTNNYNYLYNLINPVSKQKQGGKMNKIKYFQQGGAAPQQDMQQQIIQLVQAAMQGDQKATQTIQQVMQAAEQGDQQAIQLAQMIQQVMEQMKGQTQVAKMGSKLEYIKSLKYAKGGKTCLNCETEKKKKIRKK